MRMVGDRAGFGSRWVGPRSIRWRKIAGYTQNPSMGASIADCVNYPLLTSLHLAIHNPFKQRCFLMAKQMEGFSMVPAGPKLR
jgi:hypothetical protein